MSDIEAGLDAALAAAEPPAHWRPAAQALFWDAQGAWARAHELVAEDGSAEAAWAHAYLHRREGDLGNARYWYGRAGKPEAHAPLDEERRAILIALLGG